MNSLIKHSKKIKHSKNYNLKKEILKNKYILWTYFSRTLKGGKYKRLYIFILNYIYF